MVLTDQEFIYYKGKIEELQKIIREIKELREEVPALIANKLNEGLGSLESGLHILLDSTYGG